MKYTQYFSKVLSANGAPHLSSNAFKIYMNIVALENRVVGMEKCKLLNQANPGHIDFEISKILTQIKAITNERTPEEQIRKLSGVE